MSSIIRREMQKAIFSHVFKICFNIGVFLQITVKHYFLELIEIEMELEIEIDHQKVYEIWCKKMFFD